MKRFAIVFFLLGSTAPLGAQNAPPPSAEGAFEDALFAPELIMQHRRAIDLTDEQRDAISRLIQELQGKVVRLQWELLDEVEALTQTLEGDRVDLDRAMDQLNRTLNTEKEIKEAHLELLIRIKNVLRPDQQQVLRRLRNEVGG